MKKRQKNRTMKRFLENLIYFIFDLINPIYLRFIATEEELMVERNKTLIKIILSLRIICHILFVTLVSIIVALITCNN